MNNPADARLPDDLTVLRNMRDAAVSEFRRKALDAAIVALGGKDEQESGNGR